MVETSAATKKTITYCLQDFEEIDLDNLNNVKFLEYFLLRCQVHIDLFLLIHQGQQFHFMGLLKDLINRYGQEDLALWVLTHDALASEKVEQTKSY